MDVFFCLKLGRCSNTDYAVCSAFSAYKYKFDVIIDNTRLGLSRIDATLRSYKRQYTSFISPAPYDTDPPCHEYNIWYDYEDFD